MDSRKIPICGVVEDLEESLEKSLNVSFLIDVIVIVVPEAWGLLLSKDWINEIRGSVDHNFSYIIISKPMGILLSYTPRPPSRKEWELRKFVTSNPRC
jgi:hypothetical protein